MSRNQKRALAGVVIARVGDVVEDWDELALRENPELEGIDPREAAQTIANWLGRLPGDRWDLRLPHPI